MMALQRGQIFEIINFNIKNKGLKPGIHSMHCHAFKGVAMQANTRRALAQHKIIIIMFRDATIPQIEDIMNQAWNAFHVYRKTLIGEEREAVLKIINDGIATRPILPDYLSLGG